MLSITRLSVQALLALLGALPLVKGVADVAASLSAVSDCKPVMAELDGAAQMQFLMYNTLRAVPKDERADLDRQVSPLLGTAVSVTKLDRALSLLRAVLPEKAQPAPSAGQQSSQLWHRVHAEL